MKDFILFLNNCAHSFTATCVFFFHFSATCYLDSNGSTKILESTDIFGSFLEGPSSTGSRILCKNEVIHSSVTFCDLVITKAHHD
jgi:hypothetical protein